jgi:hypothetical protein
MRAPGPCHAALDRHVAESVSRMLANTLATRGTQREHQPLETRIKHSCVLR